MIKDYIGNNIIKYIMLTSYGYVLGIDLEDSIIL